MKQFWNYENAFYPLLICIKHILALKNAKLPTKLLKKLVSSTQQNIAMILYSKQIPSDKGNPYSQASDMLSVELKKIEAFFQNLLKPDMLLGAFYPLEP